MGQNVVMRVVAAALLATALVASASGCARGLPEVGEVEPAPMHVPPTVLLPPSSATFSPPLPQEPDDLQSDR
ncbi:hypothetical protein ACTJJE_17930 [Mycolicibacterium sp. 22603]|uniref:hypothetical protein n=1 Tax=Mycolicibacterium sp. 22603 TaxID=3453950 RepID=UPI003F842FA7